MKKGGKDAKKTTSKGRTIKRRLRNRFLWPEPDIGALNAELAASTAGGTSREDNTE